MADMTQEELDAIKVFDVTGVELDVGLKVAWCIGGRYNSGFGVGQVSAIERKLEPYRTYNYEARKYEEGGVRPAIMVKTESLTSGRQDRSVPVSKRTDADTYHAELVIIVNQDFVGVGRIKKRRG